MEPTVLAGPVEFSPADVALIVAVLAGLFIAIMSPGWALVAVAAYRRSKAQRPGRGAGAAAGGAVGGLLVCAAVSAVVGSLRQEVGGAAGILAVLASWAACAAIARWLWPRAEPDQPARAGADRADGAEEGWGR
jgi:fucose permease